MLQKYLNENLVVLTDDNNYEKLKKASDELVKRLSKNKSRLISFTLISIDPDASIENADIQEIKELIIKYWNTFTANIKDTPITVIRAVILDALESVAKDTINACTIFLSGRNAIRYYKLLGKEKEIVEDFFRELALKIGREANNNWRTQNFSSKQDFTPAKITYNPINVGGLNITEVESQFKAASLHSSWGGENANAPYSQSANWANFFSTRISSGLTDIINKAFKTYENELNTKQLAISETLKEALAEIYEGLDNQQNAVIENNIFQKKKAELLWWKESCYSETFECSYRSLPDGAKQIALSVDYAEFIPYLYPASVDYFLQETLRNIDETCDSLLKIAEFLEIVRNSANKLQTGILNTENGAVRISLYSFVTGLIFGKYQIKQLPHYTGISQDTEITRNDILLWLFHDCQATKTVEK